jgi:hypothetical protein
MSAIAATVPSVNRSAVDRSLVRPVTAPASVNTDPPQTRNMIGGD